MLYPQITSEKWCKIHNIEPATHKCCKCGVLQTTTIPFADKDWRGLQAPLHRCGVNYQLMVAVLADKNERRKWAGMYNDLRSFLEAGVAESKD